MTRVAAPIFAWLVILLAAAIAVPAIADRVTTTINDERTIKEFTFYHEALRLIEQESTQLRNGASTRRLQADRASMEEQISIKVEPLRIPSLPGYRLFRVYNNQIDPAWIYKVALGPNGEIYRLGGFSGNDFSKMSLPGLQDGSDADRLQAVSAYYQLVEDYDPGVLQNPEDVKRARVALMTSSALSTEERQKVATLSPPTSQSVKGAHKLTLYVFDQRSMRTEKCIVGISSLQGLVIEKRDVLLDKYRITY